MDSASSTIGVNEVNWHKHMIPTARFFYGKQPDYKPGSQKSILLSLLSSRAFVSLPEIQVTRIADYNRVVEFMKDDGYDIKCYCSQIQGRKHSVYALHGYDESKLRPRHKQSRYAQLWSAMTGLFSTH